MRVFPYILAIVVANVLTAKFAPLEFWMFLVPVGTLFIGATFFLRDFVQLQHGRARTYLIIIGALIISAITSKLLGDTLWVVLASAIGFAISESADTEVFTRLKLPVHLRIWWSGVAGGLLDSIIFVVVGISPIGANFVSWEMVPWAVAGQVIVKTCMQGLAMGGVLAWNKYHPIKNWRD